MGVRIGSKAGYVVFVPGPRGVVRLHHTFSMGIATVRKPGTRAFIEMARKGVCSRQPNRRD